MDYAATAEELEQHFHGCGSINRLLITYRLHYPIICSRFDLKIATLSGGRCTESKLDEIPCGVEDIIKHNKIQYIYSSCEGGVCNKTILHLNYK